MTMPDLGQLTTTTISLHTLVLLVFYFVLGVYAVFSAILYYHWKAYAADTKVTTYTLITYFGTTIPLLIIMTILAFLIK